MHSFCYSSVMLLQVSLITYCWLITIDSQLQFLRKYVRRIVHTDIHGSDFEGKVNLFPMVANWNREKPSDASYEMSCLQPTFFVREGRTLADVVVPLKPKKEHT